MPARFSFGVAQDVRTVLERGQIASVGCPAWTAKARKRTSGAFRVGTHDDLVTALGLAVQEERVGEWYCC